MIWAAISANTKTDLAFIENTMDSNLYTTFLDHFLLPFAYINYGTGRNDFAFMQDNVSVHQSKHSKEWFAVFDRDVLNWPALCLDLNPIENVWVALYRAVYSTGKQFNSVADLKKTIEDKWACMSTACLLYTSPSPRDQRGSRMPSSA